LSPVPGFVPWLKRLAAGDEALAEPARAACQGLEAEAWLRVPDGLREVLMPLAAQYFLAAKSRRGEPVDPVPRFHLGNGARLERLNWRGDETGKGIAQSAGVMVNYRYDLAHLERNHEAYANHGEVVAAGAVTRLAKARVVA